LRVDPDAWTFDVTSLQSPDRMTRLSKTDQHVFTWCSLIMLRAMHWSYRKITTIWCTSGEKFGPI